MRPDGELIARSLEGVESCNARGFTVALPSMLCDRLLLSAGDPVSSPSTLSPRILFAPLPSVRHQSAEMGFQGMKLMTSIGTYLVGF